MVVLSTILFLGGFMLVLSSVSRLLSLFISLEYLVLSMLLLSLFSLEGHIEFFLLLVCMSVCEASVCLSLLVMTCRFYGSDFSYSLMGDKS